MQFEYELPELEWLERYWIHRPINYTKRKKIRGIYALFDEKQIVYIGMSLDLYQRLQVHKAFLKELPFEYYILQGFKNATKAEILVYEAIYINYYRPIHNKGGSFGYLYK